MNLGETIKTAREGRNMTQEDLAERCGVSRQAVSKWELGASVPSPENLALLSELLGVSLEAKRGGPETEAGPVPPSGPNRENPWKITALVLAGLLAAAVLSCCLYAFHIHPNTAPIEPGPVDALLPEGPVITGVCFFDQEGTPLDPDLGDGWKSFPTGQRVYLLVSFQQGTETEAHGAALYATPTGTEVYDRREQLAAHAVYDRTFALFSLEFPETATLHLDIVLECGGGQTVTETLNVTAVSPAGEEPSDDAAGGEDPAKPPDAPS